MLVSKRTFSTLAVMAATTFLTCQQAGAITIAAVVNGNVITTSEVREAVEAQAQMLSFQYASQPALLQKELANLRATALDSLIDRELVLAEFKRMGASLKSQWIDDDINAIIRENYKGNRDAFVRDLAASGMTLKKFRDLREKMMIVQAMRAKIAPQPPPATPKEVEDYYKKNVDKWREGGRVKISTITIPKYEGEAGATAESQRKLAEDIRRKLVNGADFANMARSYSKDVYSESGGAREWMRREELPPVIAEAAFGLKTGGVSSVIEIEGNYMIIACDAMQAGAAKPLKDMRTEVERMVSMEKSKVVLDKWMENLRKKATIRKF